jgi:hypothetical protein
LSRKRRKYRIGPGVEGVGAEVATRRFVERVNGGDDGAADIVHVKNWRESVEARGVKLVAIHHGDVSKGLKVSLRISRGDEIIESRISDQVACCYLHDCRFHAPQAVGHHGCSAVREQSAGFDAAMQVPRYRSHVTRHTSHVTRHTSHVTRHLFIIPLVDDTAFLLAFTTHTRATSSGQ